LKLRISGLFIAMLVLGCFTLVPLKCLALPAEYENKNLSTKDKEKIDYKVSVSYPISTYEEETESTYIEETEYVASHIWEIHHKLAVNRYFQEDVLKGRRWTISWDHLSNRPMVAFNDAEKNYGYRYILNIRIYNSEDEWVGLAIVRIRRNLEIAGYSKDMGLIFYVGIPPYLLSELHK
jgi:hypothetical protein